MNWKKAIFILCGCLMFAGMVAISLEFFNVYYRSWLLSSDWKITEENWKIGIQMFFVLYSTIILSLLAYPLAPFFLFGTVYLRGKRKALMAVNPELLQTKQNKKAKNTMIICLTVLTLLILAYYLVRNPGICPMWKENSIWDYIVHIWDYIVDMVFLPFFDTASYDPMYDPYVAIYPFERGYVIFYLANFVCAIFGPLFFYYRSQTRVKGEKVSEEAEAIPTEECVVEA